MNKVTAAVVVWSLMAAMRRRCHSGSSTTVSAAASLLMEPSMTCRSSRAILQGPMVSIRTC